MTYSFPGPLQRPALLHSILVSFLLLVGVTSPAVARENEDCLMCHEDVDATGTRGGRELSVFVDLAILSGSVHGDLECVDCHSDLQGADLPHDDDLLPARCESCHDDATEDIGTSVHARAVSCGDCHGYHDVLSPSDPEASVYRWNSRIVCAKCHRLAAREQESSVHGRSEVRRDELAPSCVTCHSHHQVFTSRDQRSPTAMMNIPLLCGKCHHEGTEVSRQHEIPQDRILENYSQSIHGEGVFRKGLTVTAVCTSCHTSHMILEHTDPRSSIHGNNVAETCSTCHARIEQVHVKVIEGRLWEEEPHKIPSCVECHSPHKIRRRPPQPSRAGNEDCLMCHSKPDLTMVRDEETISLYVDEQAHDLSAHAGTACAQCHVGVSLTDDRPCVTATAKVDCSICHAEQVEDYITGTHGMLAARGDPDAPVCLDCHEKHSTQQHLLPSSPTFSLNVPRLCARCHQRGEAAAKRIESEFGDITESYEMSIHGKGILESGLVVSASCTDCHTAHHELPPDNPSSSVHTDNIANTCGSCHHGIEEIFKTSIHWPGNVETDRELPTCEDCHTSHQISRTDIEGFRLKMMNQCGRCHEDESETFFDTYHGKVSRLGSEGAAKCYDCHGTHDILPTYDPDSRLSRGNVVETCAQCHTGAHRRFAGYLTHATHHDPDKYPFLFYAFWAMTILLVSVLTIAIFHTMAWMWRLWRTREHWQQHKKVKSQRLYRRFAVRQRVMHLVMLLSFLMLALTGMTLKFSYMNWASVLSAVLGGFDTMGVLHRFGAIVLIAVFLFHLKDLWRMKRESGNSWISYITGKNSMLFNSTDIKQVFQSVKWFFGFGERPPYGRFTYWEKFDYFAVFWGVIIIGSTGLVLWFPELFTRLLPGQSVNIATIIHSDEALLAVGFIFTIHFFNTHFRPDKFPLDSVIFTGRVSLEELRHDKPAEYEEFMRGRSDKEVESELVKPYPPRVERSFKVFGFLMLGIGLTLIALIVYSMLFGYR